jgi:anaerobic selenocysteine-containing dehydrogenase
LFLLSKIARNTGALTDAVPRPIKEDHLLVCSDQNPNSTGARLTGLAPAKLGSTLPKIARAVCAGTIRTLLVFGEDILQHGFEAEWLDQLECLVVSDILPNATTARAHFLLPGCAHAEKRGTFTNIQGRVQKFMKAVEPPGHARPEWEFLHGNFCWNWWSVWMHPWKCDPSKVSLTGWPMISQPSRD